MILLTKTKSILGLGAILLEHLDQCAHVDNRGAAGMILPTKHISFSESILGLGAALLELLEQRAHVDELWKKFEKINNTDAYPAYQTFDNFLLALDLLYLLGLLDLEDEGSVCRASA